EEETVYNNVADAFAGVGSSITKVQNKITQEINNVVNNVITKVEGDSLSWSDDANAFVARHEKRAEEKGRAVQENSKITFLANGDLSSTSTDAVTGNQLFETNSKVATYLGGGASFNEGTWTPPSFKVKTAKEDGEEEETVYNNVADAFAGVGNSITNIHKEVKNEINQVVAEDLVQQETEDGSITIGAGKGGSEVNIADSASADRRLSGVKEAVNANEAINKGQLDKSLQDLSKNLQSEDSAVIHYDKSEDGNGTINYKSVTLGGKDKSAVALHNVADGTISSESHDAINGKQINKIGEDVAKFLGGNGDFNNGVFTGPTYILSKVEENGSVENITFNDVGAAFTGLDKNIKNVNARIKEVSVGVAQDSLSWSTGDDAFVAKHGTGKTNSKITFLLDGDVSDGSTDAVTGGQLYSLNERFASYLGGGAGYNEETKTWKAPLFTVKTVKADGSSEDETYN
ncbi:hypothetical protein MCO_01842, partial [Bartonella sp. DB5-6]